MRPTFLINEIHKKHLLNVISNIFCNLARAYSWRGEVCVQSVNLRKLATASFKSWLPYSTLWVTQVLLSDNLWQNKMEQQTPIPPKSRMKPREGQKRAIFPSLIWEGGGGRGGLGFSFTLSKIVVEPFSGHCLAKKNKTAQNAVCSWFNNGCFRYWGLRIWS